LFSRHSDRFTKAFKTFPARADDAAATLQSA
jgi:hypothetical protein